MLNEPKEDKHEEDNDEAEDTAWMDTEVVECEQDEEWQNDEQKEWQNDEQKTPQTEEPEEDTINYDHFLKGNVID